MAELERDMEDTEEQPAEPAPVARLGFMQLATIVVLVALTQVGVTLVMGSLGERSVQSAADEDEVAVVEAETPVEEEIPVESLQPANYLPLNPALVVNFEHEGKTRFLQATVQIMTRDRELYDQARIHTPALRNSLLLLLGTVDYDAVSTRQGKEALQAEALVAVDDTLARAVGKRGIDALYFTDFVVQ